RVWKVLFLRRPCLYWCWTACSKELEEPLKPVCCCWEPGCWACWFPWDSSFTGAAQPEKKRIVIPLRSRHGAVHAPDENCELRQSSYNYFYNLRRYQFNRLVLRLCR